MIKLTQCEIEKIIYKNFCLIPCSDIARQERHDLVKVVCEVIENRKKSGEWIDRVDEWKSV